MKLINKTNSVNPKHLYVRVKATADSHLSCSYIHEPEKVVNIKTIVFYDDETLDLEKIYKSKIR